MGYYVHLSVTYSADLDGDVKPRVAALVEKTKAAMAEPGEDGCREAGWFLDAVLDERNYNCGPKGSLFTWGLVGNYTSGETFVEALAPFFEAVLREEIGACQHDHIVVFIEPEGSEQAQAYEIFLEDREEYGGDGYGPLVVKHHMLPFCWNQF